MVMPAERMSDGEIGQRFEAIHSEVRMGFVDMRSDLEALRVELVKLTTQVAATNGRVQDIERWRAGVKGFLLAVTIFASGPTMILGWMALHRAIP